MLTDEQKNAIAAEEAAEQAHINSEIAAFEKANADAAAKLTPADHYEMGRKLIVGGKVPATLTVVQNGASVTLPRMDALSLLAMGAAKMS